MCVIFKSRIFRWSIVLTYWLRQQNSNATPESGVSATRTLVARKRSLRFAKAKKWARLLKAGSAMQTNPSIRFGFPPQKKTRGALFESCQLHTKQWFTALTLKTLMKVCSCNNTVCEECIQSKITMSRLSQPRAQNQDSLNKDSIFNHKFQAQPARKWKFVFLK